MKKKQLLCGFLVVLLVSSLAFGIGRSLPDTAKILPPETMVLINISDVNALQKQFRNTSLYKLYKDPAMAPFVNAFQSKWQQNLLKSSDEMSKILADVNATPSGRLAIAFVLSGKAKQTGEPAFMMVSQWGKNIKAIETALDKAVKKSIDNGARQEKETIRGRQIITITEKEMASVKTPASKTKAGGSMMKPSPHRFASVADDDTAGDGNIVNDDTEYPMSEATASSPETISYCLFDDVLMAAEDKEALKFMISRIEGGEGLSLADNDNYQKTLAAVGPTHDIDVYVNIEQIIKTIAAQDSGGQMGTQIANFGLDNVSSLGATVSVGRMSGSPAIIKGLLKINGAKKGIMKMIEPQNAPVQVPRFIDASGVSLSVFNISIKNVYEELLKIMSGMSPGLATAMNAPLAPADEKGQGKVELKKDILDYLGSGIVVAASIKKPFAAGADPTKTITAIAITDRAAIEKSLATLHGFLSQGKTDTKRELLGHTIYVTEMDGLAFMTNGGKQPLADVAQKQQLSMPKLAFTVTDTHLIFGTEDNVAQAIRLLSNKESGSLTTAPWFVRAKAALPDSVGMAGLSDSRTYGEYLWWVLKENAKKKSSVNSMDPMQMAASGLDGFADFSLLPDFNAIKKYLGVSAQYLVSRPDGYYFVLQQLDLKAE
ncbi:MAG: hypothetical protein Q7T18_09825 [Sedimentisphaerales bacterium]|nr:hypothetical protein [Sedimentisphaerales bacterium]